jgi:hypothetical protein
MPTALSEYPLIGYMTNLLASVSSRRSLYAAGALLSFPTEQSFRTTFEERHGREWSTPLGPTPPS